MQKSLSYFPPGNRFHPTDEELIRYYLYKIVNGGLSSKDATVIKDYNLYGEEEPWEIFNKFEGDKLGDNGLYFCTKLSKKTPNSTKKKSRTVGSNGGTWHGDGSNDIKSSLSGEENVIGRKKRFLYKNNRQSDQHGCWIMLEYGSESISDSTVISQLKKSKYGFSRKRKLMDSEGIIEVPPNDEIINSERTTSQPNQEPQQIIQNQNMWPMVGILSIEDDGGRLSTTEYPFHTIQNMGFEAPAIINIEPTLQVELNQINFVEEPMINEQQMEHAIFNDNRVKEIISVEDYEVVDQSEVVIDVAEVPAVSAMPIMEAGLMESFKNEANWFDNFQALLKEDGYQGDSIDLGSIWQTKSTEEINEYRGSRWDDADMSYFFLQSKQGVETSFDSVNQILLITMASLLFCKLILSAKAIEGGNLDLAESVLNEIISLISTEANIATRKVVKYFTEALVRRVNGLHPRYPLPLVPSSKLDDFYYYLFYPFYWFSYFTTKHAILDAFSTTDNKPLHVIDFSLMLYTSLWHDLMQDLANRPGGRPSFRLTSIAPKLSKKFDYLNQIRCQLTGGANCLQIDFELRQVVANNANDIVEYCMSKLRRTREDEMLVVRWSFSLHKLLSQEGAIEQVLTKVKDLKPDIMIIVEQEANHNGPDFLDRLVQSFQYYSTIFHSLEEDNFYRDVDCMEFWKRNFRRQIGNVVGCEGINRVERHESLYQWQHRLSRASFHPVQHWWKEDRLHFSPKYRIEEKDGHPMLYRDDCPLLVTSVWKHSDPTQFVNGFITLQDVIMFPLAEMSDLATSSESEDEKADDREDNMWSLRGFWMNHIAASANLFDILEHVCHVHKFPLALTWVCRGGEGNANSSEKRILRIEEMACCVNSCWKKRFVDGYVECYIKEGQGIAGKALQSNLYFVPDISLLDVVDYPYVDYAHKYFLRAAVAIKLTNIYTSSNDYVVEFLLPPHLKESSEQHLSINGLLCTLQKKCGNLWKIWCMEINGPNGSKGMFGEVGLSSIPPAAVSRSSQQVLSGGVSSLNEIMALDMSNPTSDEVETHEPFEQEVREKNAMVAPAINAESELASNGSANRDMVIRKRRKVSIVWEGFNKHEGKYDEVWATCKYCNKQYRAENTRGTSKLHKHLQKCLSKRQGGAEPQSSPLVETGVRSSSINFVFDQERSRLDIARMVIKHGYPLDMVQHELFEIFVKNLQPMFKLHSQDIAEGDVFVIYRQEKEKLIKYFDNLSCLFCLTIELLLSDDKNMTYCCLTLHFINDEWEQKKKILAFRNLSGKYDAETVHEIIKSVLIEWGITKNLRFIWLNIAPPNDQMIGDLKSKLSDQVSLLNGDVCYLSSDAQIVHLLIQDVFVEIESVLRKIRESIEYVNGTLNRRQMFQEAINQLKLQDQKLASLDVPTRWDTTFLMLESALELRNAFAHLEQTDGDFKANPSVEEWNMATIIFECLKALILHGSVCNDSIGIELFFLNLCVVFKNLIQWKRSQHTYVRSMADRMIVNFDEYWNKCCLAWGILTILNPSFKLDFVEYGYNQIYGSDVNLHLSRFLNDLKTVYHRYANDSSNPTPSTSNVADVNCCASFNPKSDDMLRGFSVWRKHKNERSSLDLWKVELDQYLEQPPANLSKDYNVLDWWHVNARKFPILRRMARDFFAIPISAIVSKSSVAEEVVNMNSNFDGVCPEIVEALVCGKDWLEIPERKINQG